MCRRQTGIGVLSHPPSTCPHILTLCLAAIGRLCEKCDGKWQVIRLTYLQRFSVRCGFIDISLSALSATRTSAPKHSFVSAMNATLGHMAVDVLFVVLQVYLEATRRECLVR